MSREAKVNELVKSIEGAIKENGDQDVVYLVKDSGQTVASFTVSRKGKIIFGQSKTKMDRSGLHMLASAVVCWGNVLSEHTIEIETNDADSGYPLASGFLYSVTGDTSYRSIVESDGGLFEVCDPLGYPLFALRSIYNAKAFGDEVNTITITDNRKDFFDLEPNSLSSPTGLVKEVMRQIESDNNVRWGLRAEHTTAQLEAWIELARIVKNDPSLKMCDLITQYMYNEQMEDTIKLILSRIGKSDQEAKVSKTFGRAGNWLFQTENEPSMYCNKVFLCMINEVVRIIKRGS